MVRPCVISQQREKGVSTLFLFLTSARVDPDGLSSQFFQAINNPGAAASMGAYGVAINAASIPASDMRMINYRARQATLNSIAGGAAALTLSPLAPVAGPVSAVASTVAFFDKLAMEGATATDASLYVITLAPMAKLFKVSDEIARIFKIDQAALGVTGAAASVATTVSAADEGDGKETNEKDLHVPHQVKPDEDWADPWGRADRRRDNWVPKSGGN